MLMTIWNDIRYSVRTLARNPGVTALAVVTIALGIGVNAGIFTTLNGLLFRDLSAPDAHELVTVAQTFDGVPSRIGNGSVRPVGFTTDEYRSLSAQTTTLSGIYGQSDPTRTTLGGESPREIIGTIVTCEYFDVLRQPPALGRALRAEDCETGAGPVVVLTHELWTTAFESDPGIIGRVIELNRQLFTVVGVAQEGTHANFGIYRTQYFAPIATEPLLLPNENNLDNDNLGWLSVIGRRAASLEQVRAELGVIATRFDAEQAGRTTTLYVERAKALPGFLRDMFMRLAAVLMVPFAFVLLIACANVANLLLARATARNREMAIRFSLGASRARVIRQLLTESVLISIAGGVLGSVLAVWAFQTLTSVVIPALTIPGLPPFFVDASPDFRVVAVMTAVMLGTGLLFGLAPAFQVSKPDLHAAIKQGAQSTGSLHGGRLQGTLVGVQVATTMVLMVAVGLLLRGLTATQTTDPGFEVRDVAFATYDLEGGGYDPAEAAAFQRRLLDEVRALPGVEAAGQAITEPLNPDTEEAGIRLPTQDPGQGRVADLNGVTPDYFDVVGIPIVRGRAFEDADMTDGAGVAIVTESTARNLWPDQDPIGQTLLMGSFNGDITLEVVGVVGDAQVTVVGQVAPFYLYLPASPPVAQLLRLVVKSRTDFSSTAAAIRAAAARLDPGLVVQVSPLESNLEFWRRLSGILTGLTGSLGLLALTLGAVGIYGVVAYFVGRRTREIAIRVALGARPSDVLAMILRRTMRPVVVGAVVGLAGAIAVSRVLSGVLFGVSPFDPLGIGVAALFVVGVAFAAGFLPGRSATRQQPLAALHYE
jgi:putative ABC transport system permease protein